MDQAQFTMPYGRADSSPGRRRSALSDLSSHLIRCPLRTVKPISCSQWNGGFDAHSGPCRGDPCRRAFRPFEASKPVVCYFRNTSSNPAVRRRDHARPTPRAFARDPFGAPAPVARETRTMSLNTRETKSESLAARPPELSQPTYRYPLEAQQFLRFQGEPQRPKITCLGRLLVRSANSQERGPLRPDRNVARRRLLAELETKPCRLRGVW
jgi:hypothetical protein